MYVSLAVCFDSSGGFIKDMPDGSIFAAMTNKLEYAIAINQRYGVMVGVEHNGRIYYAHDYESYTELVALTRGDTLEVSRAVMLPEHFPFERHVYDDDSLLPYVQKKIEEPHLLMSIEEWKLRFGENVTDEVIAFIREHSGVWELPSFDGSFRFNRGIRDLVDVQSLELDEKLRFDFEMSIIEEYGFEETFLVVNEVVAYCRLAGIQYFCRGSANSSYVAYLLKITSINPMHYDLDFERFINPDRIRKPDIDIDIQSDKVSAVEAFIVRRFGEHHVKHFSTFTRQMFSQSVIEFNKVYESKFKNELIRMSKIVKNITHAETLDTFRVFQFEEPKNANALRSLNSLKMHQSVHPSGLLISPLSLQHIATSSQEKNGIDVLTLTEVELRSFGIEKFDFLTLDTLKHVNQLIEETGVPLSDIPLDDEAVFELFASGQTDGVFQFESGGMKEKLMSLRPSNILELSIATALYRPGPIKYIPMYLKNRTAEKNYPFSDVLSTTSGVVVFQEDFNRLISILRGISVGEADNIRRNCSKDISYRKQFFRETYERCADFPTKNMFFDMLYSMSEYSFPKSHAVSYAILAYKIAWYKVNFPSDFIRVFEHKLSILMSYVIEKGVPVKLPHFEGGVETRVVNNCVLLGHRILGIASDLIGIHERALRTTKSFEELLVFYAIELNQQDMNSLIFGGYFDDKGKTRASLHAFIDYFYNKMYSEHFDLEEYRCFSIPPIKDVPEYSTSVLQQKEREVFGFTTIQKESPFTLSQDVIPLKEAAVGFVKTTGVISKLRLCKTKNQKEMAFATLSDKEHHRLPLVIFPNVLSLFRNNLYVGAIVNVSGVVEERNGELQMNVKEVSKHQ